MIKVYVHNTEDWIGTSEMVVMYVEINGVELSVLGKSNWTEIGEL